MSKPRLKTTRNKKIKATTKTKLKTKSSVTKRVSFTASGLPKITQANKQHNMRKRSKRQLRNNRGTVIMSKPDQKRMKKLLRF